MTKKERVILANQLTNIIPSAEKFIKYHRSSKDYYPFLVGVITAKIEHLTNKLSNGESLEMRDHNVK